jgi:protein gp37
MGDKSAIEWTDATWNPVRGCSIVSKGCTNCYAMRQAHRASGAGGAYEGLTKLTKGGPVWTGEVRLVPELLLQPWRWRRPRRIFVNSMSDLFHEALSDDSIDKVFAAMALAPQHIYQVLTKRPARMKAYIERVVAGERPLCERASEIRNSFIGGLMVGQAHGADPKNVQTPFRPWPFLWLGVSVEDQATADERIPLLLQTPAAVRWISAEPLLGPVSFVGRWVEYANPAVHINWLEELDWVVVGGESGPGARPMHPDWARDLRDQCAAVEVPFFFKQWGAYLPTSEAKAKGFMPTVARVRTPDADDPDQACFSMCRVGKDFAGRVLDGRTHDEYPAT